MAEEKELIVSHYNADGEPVVMDKATFLNGLRLIRPTARRVDERAAAAMDFDPEAGGHTRPMDAPHQAHLDSVLDELTVDLRAKYEAGQREHAGNLWEHPGLLDEAINEVLDLAVYLYTMRQNIRRKGISL